jgi:hypothetical protein
MKSILLFLLIVVCPGTAFHETLQLQKLPGQENYSFRIILYEEGTALSRIACVGRENKKPGGKRVPSGLRGGVTGSNPG